MPFRTTNEISLGDLAIAVKRLPTQNRDHLVKIAACLGFGLEVPESPKAQRKGVWDKSQSPERDEPRDALTYEPSIQAQPKKTRNRVSLPKPPVPQDGYISRIESLERVNVATPAVIKNADPLNLEESPSMRQRRSPVFPERSERAILSASIAVQTETGPVDMQKTLDRLVHLKLIDNLPRQDVPTLKYGVQLMLDRSESMLPYYQDLLDLKKRLRKISGNSRFSCRQFKGSPYNHQACQKSHTQKKIINHVPILIVTDFGIGAPFHSRDRARPGEWMRFAQEARKKNCPVVVLIPHKPKFWPDQALADFLCIHWNRTTSAGDLRKVIGIGHRLRG